MWRWVMRREDYHQEKREILVKRFVYNNRSQYYCAEFPNLTSGLSVTAFRDSVVQERESELAGEWQ